MHMVQEWITMMKNGNAAEPSRLEMLKSWGEAGIDMIQDLRGRSRLS